MKMELLKDNPDNDLLHDLWKQSFNIRRLCIRELKIDEVLERFPGYRRSEIVSIVGCALIKVVVFVEGDTYIYIYIYRQLVYL
jgi:hypothetical protein